MPAFSVLLLQGGKDIDGSVNELMGEWVKKTKNSYAHILIYSYTFWGVDKRQVSRFWICHSQVRILAPQSL